MSIELKVKAKSLAAESVIIRKEENKQLTSGRWNKERQRGKQSDIHYATFLRLHNHRTGIVRHTARLTHLARAFIRGKSYSATEQGAKNPIKPYQINQIKNMVNKYGGEGAEMIGKDDIEHWLLS